MCLIYHLISSSIVSTGTRMIICTWNSQMASSSSQIWVLCSTLTMSSFPLEKNIQWLNRDQRNPSWLPGLSFAQISPLLCSSSPFWLSFNKIEVSNAVEYSILCIRYCYNLQQYILIAFDNNFDTPSHVHIHVYSSQKQNIAIPQNTSEANSCHSLLFFGREQWKGQFYKLWKFIQNFPK